jgi:hypothetical protein
MTEYQKRAVAELEELKGRYMKLLAFFDTPVFEGLPDLDKRDLRSQAHHMGGYVSALDSRVSRFNTEGTTK